jgi:hypothetical protein
MANVEAKLVFSVVMSVFALVVWLADRPREKTTIWAWLPRFDFSNDRISGTVTQHFYIAFFLIWIPIVWIFD